MSPLSPLPPRPRALVPRQNAQGGCLASTIYLILLTGGAITLYARFYEPLRDLLAKQDWEPVTCKISFSRAVPADKVPGAYRPEIRYYYQYGGQPHFGLINRGADTKADVEAMVKRYPAGAETVCYVNPDNPKDSVLQRGFRPALLVALIPLGMVLVGLAGFSSLLFRRAFPRARLYPLFSGPRTHQTSTGLPEHLPRARQITLRPRRGLRSGLLLLLLIAIVWNTLMFFLAREVFNNWRSGEANVYVITLTIFSIPFILAGILLALLPFYFLRRLFHPRPVVTLSRPMVAIGDSIEMSWRISGRIDHIRRLRILLEGHEEATYQRDDEMRTDYEVFATLPLSATQDPQQIRSGRCTLIAPPTLIPSFESRHNKITWAIRMQTDSRPWPGINEEFELLILPGSLTAGSDRPVQAARPSPYSSPSFPEPRPA